ncbi:MAG: hypothetical protein QW767_02645 [Thermoprotei archaeon]
MDLGVKINREVQVLSYAIADVFQGFEKLKVVRDILGPRTDEIFANTRIVLYPRKGYLSVDDETGWILVSAPYLKTADERYLYLDLIHELVHVRQFYEGKELFDERYVYVDRPTEIEAYAVAAKEAKRIGMNDKELLEYLKVDWVSDEEFSRLLKNIGVKVEPEQKGSKTRRRTSFFQK